MREKIKLAVTVEINYTTKDERKRAIKRAKEVTTSTSILSANSVVPLKAVLI